MSKTAQVGANPTGIAYGAGSLWVTNQSEGTVIRLNPQSLRKDATIPVGAGPAGIAFGDGAVWVANSIDGTLSRINVDDHIVTSHTIDPKGGANGVAVDGRTVWVSNQYAGTLSEVDTRRFTLVGTVPTGGAPFGLAVSGDRLWFATASAGTVLHRGGVLRFAATGLAQFGSNPAVVRSGRRVRRQPLAPAGDDQRRSGRVPQKRRREWLPSCRRPGHRTARAHRWRAHVHLPPPQGSPLLHRSPGPAARHPPRYRTGFPVRGGSVQLLHGDQGRRALPATGIDVRPLVRRRRRRPCAHRDLPPDQTGAGLPPLPRLASCLRHSVRQPLEERGAGPGHRPVHGQGLRPSTDRRGRGGHGTRPAGARAQPAFSRVVAGRPAGRVRRPHSDRHRHERRAGVWQGGRRARRRRCGAKYRPNSSHSWSRGSRHSCTRRPAATCTTCT